MNSEGCATLHLDPLAAGDLLAEATLTGDEIRVRCRGTADLGSDALDAFLVALDAEARRLGAPCVAVDMRELDLMSSSCFKMLVGWIRRVHDRPPTAQYRVRFHSNPHLHWQQRSLQALRCLAADLVTIVV